MRAATDDPFVEFIEGLITAPDRLCLLTARSIEGVPRCDDIIRQHVFYRRAQRPGDMYLTAKDCLFRDDPDWFWNIPDSPTYRLFRRYAPLMVRNSGFYHAIRTRPRVRGCSPRHYGRRNRAADPGLGGSLVERPRAREICAGDRRSRGQAVGNCSVKTPDRRRSIRSEPRAV